MTICNTCKTGDKCPASSDGTTECIIYTPCSGADIPNIAMPCHFCGGSSVYWDHINIDFQAHHFVMCRACGCEGPYSTDHRRAMELWCHRTIL